ncbi:MAG: hypothetical protein HOQ37_21790 [Cupriavidus sp.]|nr:hypothetical protein [Cupriavidus sp.]
MDFHSNDSRSKLYPSQAGAKPIPCFTIWPTGLKPCRTGVIPGRQAITANAAGATRHRPPVRNLLG